MLALVGLYLVRARIVALEPGLAVLAGGLALAGVALVLAIAAFASIWQSGATGLGAAYAGFFLAILLLAYPAYSAVEALRLPAINDVSTDLADPPAFSLARAAVEKRSGFTHGAYPATFGRAQRRAYPDIQPVILQSGVEDSFRIVQSALQPFGWMLVASDPPRRANQEGTIEVSATSTVLRLREDMVIRIRPFGEETRIDLRSASRLGTHDLGSNARRIAAVIAAISDTAREN